MTEKAKSKKVTVIVVIIALLLSIGGGIGYWWYKQHQLPVLNKAPDFTLQTVDDKQQSFYNLQGKVRLVEFFYAQCPDICPTTTANMVRIQNQFKQQHEFGNQVEFVSITIDPARDTSEILKKYAANLGVDPSGWMFMRGSEAETKKVAKGFHVFFKKDKEGFFIHSTNGLILVDQDNNVRKIYQEGDKMQVDQIAKDIETLTK